MFAVNNGEVAAVFLGLFHFCHHELLNQCEQNSDAAVPAKAPKEELIPDFWDRSFTVCIKYEVMRLHG